MDGRAVAHAHNQSRKVFPQTGHSPQFSILKPSLFRRLDDKNVCSTFFRCLLGCSSFLPFLCVFIFALISSRCFFFASCWFVFYFWSSYLVGWFFLSFICLPLPLAFCNPSTREEEVVFPPSLTDCYHSPVFVFVHARVPLKFKLLSRAVSLCRHALRLAQRKFGVCYCFVISLASALSPHLSNSLAAPNSAREL